MFVACNAIQIEDHPKRLSYQNVPMLALTSLPVVEIIKIVTIETKFDE